MLHILFTLMATLATMTWMMSNPISMALTILLMSICIAMIMASFMSSWVAFLLFLIYVGGMLVMFAYFVATSPNAPINMKPQLILGMLMFLSLYFMSDIKSTPFKSNQSLMLNTFYTSDTLNTLILLALILLLTMVIVVKIVNTQKGPLRPFNK